MYFAAVVGMNAQNPEGKTFQQVFQGGRQEGFGNPLAAGHNFSLRHAIHRVDGI
jgi:hypothetical protein